MSCRARYEHLFCGRIQRSIADDDFVCKAAKTVDEAAKLVKAGFEFVCEIQDCRLIRKRK